MANPTRTWTITINNAFDSAIDHQDQFKQAVFALKTACLTANWTVELSNNGTTADASDNWTTKADVNQNTTAAGGAWIVLKSPAAFVTNSEFVYLLLVVNTASGDTTPNDITVYMSKTPYTGGSTTVLPTNAGYQTTLFTKPIVAWSSAIAGTYMIWTTARGDVRMCTKGDGQNFLNTLWMIGSNEDGDGGGRGDLRYYLFATGSNGDVITSGSLNGSTNWRGLRRDGAVQQSAMTGRSTLWDGAVSWTNGIDDFGEAVTAPIDLYENSPASDGRYMGQIVDLFAAPPPSIFDTLDDSENAQTYRKVLVGDLWMYMPTASLPMD